MQTEQFLSIFTKFNHEAIAIHRAFLIEIRAEGIQVLSGRLVMESLEIFCDVFKTKSARLLQRQFFCKTTDLTLDGPIFTDK